ncbi:MAG: BRCT domain-containing protein, partial [Planctomycetota bacterium]
GLIERHEDAYHNFAVNYMLKAFVPADFAPGAEVEAATSEQDADLGNQSFLFTGKLSTMTRKEAQGKVTDANGTNAKSVTKTLDYLVIGDEGSPLFGEGAKGSKMVKAEGLQDEGHPVKIISETAFLQMLSGAEREFTEEQVMQGCERLWEMALEDGEEDGPRRSFAILYIKRHHIYLGPSMTERALDPGAEIPQAFFTFERFKPLFSENRVALRNLARQVSRWELARWAPPLHEIVELTELGRREVTEVFEEALLAPEIKETERFRLGRDKLTVDGVYRFCESLDGPTRQLGMALIARYDDLAIPSALFKLTESPDRQLRAFVIRTLWSLYRRRGITMHWTPTPV